eukprot:6183760-Pleurochrysis_carterae.AAC.2
MVERGPTEGRSRRASMVRGVGSAARSLGSVETREKTERARRRRWRVRESFCGDGDCASSWQTNESFAALFSIDEHLGLVTARPDFRSPRFPSRN